jgi:hypothetical protein
MHPFVIVGSLFPATAFAVVGFFTLFAAERAAGRIRTIGKVLGIWLFVLAGVVILAGVVASVAGPARWGGGMGSYHERMMQRYHSGWMQPPAPEQAPAPAPTTAPPAAQPK